MKSSFALRSALFAALVGSGALAFLTGCGGKIPVTRYYVLELQTTPPAASKLRLNADVAVARFRSPQALAQDRIIYRPSASEVGFYNYHRWAGFPADLITDAFILELKSSGLFRGVVGMESAPRTEYLLRGQVANLEEVDIADKVSARVALRLELIDARTRAVIWAGQARDEQPVADRSIEGVVRALNEGVQRAIGRLIKDLGASSAFVQ
jgi:ABC-type uncharacterized transport system auxiliary subunit